MTTLSQLGEFGLIARLQAIVERHPLVPMSPRETAPAHDLRSALHVDIGDDAAVWQPTPGTAQVLTCDAFVEGRHFRPIAADTSQADLEAIGARVATANLSDIAAMAALPRFALVSLGIPKDTPLAHIEAIYEGLCATLHAAGARIIGGNITATTGPLFLDITAAGEVTPGKATTRSGAQSGDLLGVTGFPGHAAAGLHALLHPPSDADAPTLEPLTHAYLRPTARLQEAQHLAPFVHAMTDISDGLLHDLQHLLDPAGCDALLHRNKLPLSPALRHLAAQSSRPPHEYLWTPSDDYELLFCAPPANLDAINARWQMDTPLHWIGELVSSGEDQSARVWLADEAGKRVHITGCGWDHFKA